MATITILQHRATLESQIVNEQLSFALNSRIVIEQAKGILAERRSLDMEQAFTLLRTYARNHNLRLIDVAQQIIDRTLDTAALEPPRA
jgi:AmiR/NasT family two-component response regulator